MLYAVRCTTRLPSRCCHFWIQRRFWYASLQSGRGDETTKTSRRWPGRRYLIHGHGEGLPARGYGRVFSAELKLHCTGFDGDGDGALLLRNHYRDHCRIRDPAMAALTSAMALSTPALSHKFVANAFQNSFLSGGASLRRVAGNGGAIRVVRKGLGVVAMARKPPVVEKDDSDVDQRFRLNNLSPQPGSRHRQKRKGRGIAAGQGASCGFGMRGQKSRSGSGVRPGFEGGQTPLYRRLPKLRGIAGGMGAGLPKYVAVNLTDIAASFQEGEEVSLEALKERRVLNPSGRDRKLPLKILADGELDFKVTVKAGAISAAAMEKLESLGCECEILPKKKKWLSAQYSKNQSRADAYFAKKRGESA